MYHLTLAVGDSRGHAAPGGTNQTGGDTNPPPNQPSGADNDLAKDQLFLLQAARKATERGAHGEADALLRSLAALFPEKPQPEARGTETPGSTTSNAPPIEDTRGDTPPSPGAPKIAATGNKIIQKEGAVLFIVGEIPDHTYCGLPAFYDKNVKALKGSVPLTIFDPVWQKQAATHHAERRNVERTVSDERRYTGHPAPGEWTQSYAQWSRNYQGLISAIKDVYNMPTIANWFCLHRDNINNFMRREGFCAGFRYDLAIRANAFQCNMIRQDKNVFPDISTYRKKLGEEEKAMALEQDKKKYIDNPYIAGGAREQYNPYTSLEQPAAQQKKSTQENKSKGNGNQQGRSRGRWEPYHQNGGGYQDSDQSRSQGGNESPRYQDYMRDKRNDGSQRQQEPEDKPRDRVQGYKAQQGAPRENQRNQGKPT
ncbi:hypothetical protein PCASD_18387 [Puccinia coronata f. sp. avenae]|uniref:Uncharacterized protein n=1 Tax=Puccinia coronata f. sp. avenae TaxID=200324 RepID=A0A2N5T7Z6_9BASI|nr:hypothetical protein PCASD_18387 [Puccinia coronata f. sp. avenae]